MFFSLNSTSWSCRRRSFLYSSATVSKVSTTCGFSSASIAASDRAFSKSSSSSSSAARRARSASTSSTSSPSAMRRHRRRPLATRAARRSARRPLAPLAPRRPSPSAGAARRGLGVGAGIGGLEVDDVAEQDLPGGELVAPDDDRLEGERAFAEARDHGLAAGLDALGDGDLALARQKLDRAHLAEIHADRIVGAVGRLLGGLGRRPRSAAPRRARRPRGSSSPSSASSTSSASMTLMPMSESMARMSSICSEVTSSRGEDRVQLVIGDKAALLGGLDHLLDGGIGKVEERPVRGLCRGRGFAPLRFPGPWSPFTFSDTRAARAARGSPCAASLIQIFTSAALRPPCRGPPPQSAR